jgi:hypothetical protein
MPCEHFQDAVIEAAANGVAPSHELRVHLDACADCCNAFAAEQALFLSIDSGLAVKASASVSPAFLHRVRARMLQENLPRQVWFAGWPLLAGGAAAAILLGTVILHGVWAGHESGATAHGGTLPVILAGRENPATEGASVPDKFSAVGKPASPSSRWRKREVSAAKNSEIEVLVPPDQEVLLAGYAVGLRSRNSAPVIARESAEAEPAPLQVDLIQIAQLDVKPLAEAQP